MPVPTFWPDSPGTVPKVTVDGLPHPALRPAGTADPPFPLDIELPPAPSGVLVGDPQPSNNVQTPSMTAERRLNRVAKPPIRSSGPARGLRDVERRRDIRKSPFGAHPYCAIRGSV